MPMTDTAAFTQNVILADGDGTTAAPGSYFAFGQTNPVPGSTGPRFQAGAGDPSAIVTSPLGSIWIDSATGIIYQNTTGTAAGWRVATHQSLAQVLVVGNTTGPTDIAVSAGAAILLGSTDTPVTAAGQTAIHGGGPADAVPNALYCRAEAAGVDRPVQATNFEVIFFTGAGSPSGQWYSTWAALYADLTAWRNATVLESTVAVVYCRSSLTIPAGAYDLNRVEFQSSPGAGSITFADGVVLARPPFAFRNFSNGPTIRFDTITTPTYTGNVRTTRFYNCASVAPTAAATVAPFLYNATNQAVAIWAEGYCAFTTNAGGVGLFRHAGAAGVAGVYLSGTECDWDGNVWTSSGAANSITFIIENAAQQNNQGSFPAHQGGFPEAALIASGATIHHRHGANIENLGTATNLGAMAQSKQGRVPLFNWNLGTDAELIDSTLLRPGLGADVASSRSQSGEVQPAIGGATLVGDGLWTYSGALAQDAGGPAALGGFGWVFNIPTLLAVIGSTGGWASGGVVTEMGAHIFSVHRFQIPDATTIRFFIGLTGTHFGAARAGAVGTDTPAGDLLGVQFSTDRGDANYQILTQQAAGAPNLINTGVPVAGNPNVYLIIDTRATISGGASSATFYLLDAITRILLYTTTVTTAASLPASGSDLGYVSEVETRAAATRSITTIMAQISHGDI